MTVRWSVLRVLCRCSADLWLPLPQIYDPHYYQISRKHVDFHCFFFVGRGDAAPPSSSYTSSQDTCRPALFDLVLFVLTFFIGDTRSFLSTSWALCVAFPSSSKKTSVNVVTTLSQKSRSSSLAMKASRLMLRPRRC